MVLAGHRMAAIFHRLGAWRHTSRRRASQALGVISLLLTVAVVPWATGVPKIDVPQPHSEVLSAATVHVQEKAGGVSAGKDSAIPDGPGEALPDDGDAMEPSVPSPATPRPARAPGATRDKYRQPFASTSPWNMPIGSGAIYVPAEIGPSEWVVAETNYVFHLSGDDPLRPLMRPWNWGEGRCDDGAEYERIELPVPDGLIVPDAEPNYTPNNAAAFLLPDGETFVQVNALARCWEGGPVFGIRGPDQSIYGDGIRGGQGGSGLSSIGGTLRAGELTGTAPIAHALKILLWCEWYCSYTERGYRWPATRSDGYASWETYGGSVEALRMGALLAIPPSVTAASLELETEAGGKLFAAFQDYGAYLADDAYWNAHGIAIEQGALQEFDAASDEGFSSDGGPFFRDVQKLFEALHVVDNNSRDTIGGGGTPRQPLAPPIGN